MKAVRLEHVQKSFGTTVAVQDLCLKIEAGSFFAIVGPSGCGKTTTMRMIAGLEHPDGGRIQVGANVVFSDQTGEFVGPSQRDVGLMFQSYALWPHMNVYDNVSFGARVRREGRGEVRRRVVEVLERLKIANLIDRYPNELSGGQQQRVALARELVTGASVLLMDEPLSNLDARLRMDMRAELKRLHTETGKTIIYVTHDQFEALTLSSHLVVMHQGAVQQLGTPEQIYRAPANAFVSEFIGLNPINFLDARLRNGTLTIGGTTIPAPTAIGANGTARDVVIGIRPEYVSVVPEDGMADGVRARVESVFQAGPNTFVHLEVQEFGRDARLLAQSFGDGGPVATPGSEVRLLLDRDNVFVFDRETRHAL